MNHSHAFSLRGSMYFHFRFIGFGVLAHSFEFGSQVLLSLLSNSIKNYNITKKSPDKSLSHYSFFFLVFILLDPYLVFWFN